MTTLHLQAQPRSWQASENLREAIRFRQDFTTGGALAGTSYLPGHAPSYTGRLPIEDREVYMAAADTVDYIVWSYGTPIGWHTPDHGWVVPEVSYSPTTSRHQTQVRMAVVVGAGTQAPLLADTEAMV